MSKMGGVYIMRSVYKSDFEAIKILQGKNAFQTDSKNAYISETKVKLENAPIKYRGTLYLSKEFVERAYGKDAIEGAKELLKNINDGEYCSLEEFCEKVINKDYFLDIDKGFAMIGDFAEGEKETYGNSYINFHHPQNYQMYSRGELAYIEAVNYLMFSRPKKEEIIAQFQKNGSSHPRVCLDKQLLQSTFENVNKKTMLEEVIKEADRLLSLPCIKYELRDGERIYDCPREIPLAENLALAFLYTKNNLYKERLYKELKASAEMESWNPWHFLDVSDFLLLFAISYDWLYDYWTDKEKAFIRETVIKKGLKVAYDDFYGGETKQWTYFVNNWIIVCGNSIVCAAVAIMDECPEFCADVIEKSLRGLEYVYPFFAPDGGWGEGASYWEYANNRFVRYMITLRNTFGTDFGYYDMPGVKNTCNYIAAMHGARGNFNLHDVTNENPINASAISGHGYLQNNKKLFGLRNTLKEFFELKNTVMDLFYLDFAVKNIPELKLHESFRNCETGIIRSKWFDKEAACVLYHAGPNAPVHRNYDSGQFMFENRGVRWVVDLSKDLYSLPGYWDLDNIYYRVRAEGHNVYVINPDKGCGQELENKSDRIIENGENYAKVSLTGSYAKQVNSAVREYRLVGDKNLFVKDDMELKEASKIYWFMHTPADMEIIDAHKVVFSLDNKRMLFTVNANQPLKLDVMDAVPLASSPKADNSSNEGIKKIVLSGIVEGHLSIEVTLEEI